MAFEFSCLEEEAYYSLEFPGPSDEEIDAHIDACVRHHESAHDAHVALYVDAHIDAYVRHHKSAHDAHVALYAHCELEHLIPF